MPRRSSKPPQKPAVDFRDLVRHLSKGAAMLDRLLIGDAIERPLTDDGRRDELKMEFERLKMMLGKVTL